MTPDLFQGLNDAQREAVLTARGPVVILAGAGTGKTTTITRRIAHQVASGAFEPGQILAVTFTAKAAREMGGRLAALGVGGIRANTFHAEALAQFRRFSPHQPEIVASKGQILHGIAKSLPMPHRFTPLRDLATEIEWAKNRRVGPKEYLDALGDHEPPIPPELMHRVFVRYDERKRKAGLIDFEDLLERTVQILTDDTRALGTVRGRYHAFTVDEYQDVNLLQQSLLDLWLGARDDICVVGDDYQSIFGFTGATPRYLLRFRDRWEHTAVVTLTQNYRSTPEVLTVANRLVPRLGGSAKRLKPVLASGPGPQLLSFPDADAEVRAIVDRCRALHDEGVPWEEMAILTRINGRSEDFEEAFAAAKIPYQVRDGAFLARPAARALGARARRATRAPEPVPATEAVASIARDLGYDPNGRYEAGDEATRQADLHRLVQLAEGFDGDLNGFLADLEARFATEQEGRGVQLMTYHRAKGLEFEAVFLPRLEEKELPFAMATSDEDVAEERRLLYVGITRAKRHLFLSHADHRPGERRTKPKPSRFLRELTGNRASGPAPAASRSTGATPDGPRPADALADDPLFGRLRAWRRKVAVEKGVPPYVVFHDSTLAEIAEQKPGSPAALRQIKGVGPTKVQRYGEELLAIVADRSPAEEAVTASG